MARYEPRLPTNLCERVNEGTEGAPLVGVLALHGGYHEHKVMLSRLGCCVREIRQYRHALAFAHGCQPYISSSYTRKPAYLRLKLPHLEGIDGLVIPGGESTTMGHLAERLGLLDPLRMFIASGAPVMGTCAGLIFLANQVEGQKKGGQVLTGGMDLTVCRNFFGSQVDSFETNLETPLAPGRQVPAVFIRAPAILRTGANVKILANVALESTKDDAVPKIAPVAVQDGNLLGICFHPELSNDDCWHSHFLSLVKEHIASRNKKRKMDVLSTGKERLATKPKTAAVTKSIVAA